MSSLKPVSVETLSPIIYRDQPVITSALLAQMYETEEVNIRKNFFSNQERFVPGKHCFSIEGEELRELKRYVTQSNAVEIPKQARHLTLWTARGAARHAKMLNTDKAWDVFELLEENYFAPRIVHPAAPVALPYSTVDDRRPLKQAVDAWVTLMQANGKVFTHGAAWKLVNTHFSIKRISELPAEWVKDAVAYVMDEINGVQKALPAAEIDHDRAMIQQAAQQHLKTYRPLLREVENTVLDIGGQLQRLPMDARDQHQAQGGHGKKCGPGAGMSEELQAA